MISFDRRASLEKRKNNKVLLGHVRLRKPRQDHPDLRKPSSIVRSERPKETILTRR